MTTMITMFFRLPILQGTTNSFDAWVPCYWKNGERTGLPVLDNTKNGHAYSVVVSEE
jgi:hypothetical protein